MSAKPSAVHCGEVVVGEQPALVGDRVHRGTGRDHAHCTRQIGARARRARRRASTCARRYPAPSGTKHVARVEPSPPSTA